MSEPLKRIRIRDTRPLWSKKRFVIPVAVVILVLISMAIARHTDDQTMTPQPEPTPGRPQATPRQAKKPVEPVVVGVTRVGDKYLVSLRQKDQEPGRTQHFTFDLAIVKDGKTIKTVDKQSAKFDGQSQIVESVKVPDGTPKDGVTYEVIFR